MFLQGSFASMNAGATFYCPTLLSLRRQFKVTCNDSRDGNVFVQFLPAEGVAVDFDFDLGKQFVGGVFEAAEAAGGKANNLWLASWI